MPPASLLLSAAEHAVNFACSHRSTAIVSENTQRAKTGIRFSLAESALYFRFEGSGKLNLLNFSITTSKEDNS